MSRSLSATVASATRSSPDPAGSQVFVAQGTGITLFLTIARSHDSVNATLLPVGTPHFFGEVTAATGGNAEHRDHRDGRRKPCAARPSTARRPAGSCPDGRISSPPSPPQLADAGVPARLIHKGQVLGHGQYRPPPRPRPRLTDGKPGQAG